MRNHDNDDQTPRYDRSQQPFLHEHIPGAGTLADAAERGDPLARRQLDETLDYLRRAQPQERQGQEGA